MTKPKATSDPRSHGMLRNPARYQAVSRLQQRRKWWIETVFMFQPLKADRLIESDSIIARCMRLRHVMLAEAYGLVTEDHGLVTAS